jgi:hypothetical protein
LVPADSISRPSAPRECAPPSRSMTSRSYGTDSDRSAAPPTAGNSPLEPPAPSREHGPPGPRLHREPPPPRAGRDTASTDAENAVASAPSELPGGNEGTGAPIRRYTGRRPRSVSTTSTSHGASSARVAAIPPAARCRVAAVADHDQTAVLVPGQIDQRLGHGTGERDALHRGRGPAPTGSRRLFRRRDRAARWCRPARPLLPPCRAESRSLGSLALPTNARLRRPPATPAPPRS